MHLRIGIKEAGERWETVEKTHGSASLAEEKNAGLEKHIGFSFRDTAGILKQILSQHPKVDLVQLQLNYLDRENEIIQSRKCYETAKQYRLLLLDQ